MWNVEYDVWSSVSSVGDSSGAMEGAWGRLSDMTSLCSHRRQAKHCNDRLHIRKPTAGFGTDLCHILYNSSINISRNPAGLGR